MPRPLMTREQTLALERSIINYMPSLILMEQAGQSVAAEVKKYLKDKDSVVAILCGPGNNGGDGFVVARALAKEKIRVDVYVLADATKYSNDAQTMLSSLAGYPSANIFTFPDAYVIVDEKMHTAPVLFVDALFGIGLTRPLEGGYYRLVQWLNEQSTPVLSIDIPSGIDANNGNVMGIAVQADETVSFFSPKLGHVLYPGRFYKGELVMYLLVDLESIERLANEDQTIELMASDDLRYAFHPRSMAAHKGEFGHALVIGGEVGMSGAAYFCAKAALRSGAGRLSMAVPPAVAPSIWSSLPEAMCHPSKTVEEIFSLFEGKNCIALGPGLGRKNGEQNAEVVRKVCAFPGDVVIDADALYYLKPEYIDFNREPYVILTPHPKEMADMMGLTIEAVLAEPIVVATNCAKKYNAIVVLKSGSSVIACPNGRLSINVSGGPMLAKGGSGDVLTGIILAFLAQSYSPYHAARYGSLLLGEAASSLKKHEVSVLASDVIEGISDALRGVNIMNRE